MTTLFIYIGIIIIFALAFKKFDKKIPILLIGLLLVSCESDQKDENCDCYNVTSRNESLGVAVIKLKNQCSGQTKTLIIEEGQNFYNLEEGCEYCDVNGFKQSFCN